ncbi:MAG TPA: hypothetical protein VGI81_28600 [Tepidisphaeraceae bacterium]|jgi:hypothetical protein
MQIDWQTLTRRWLARLSISFFVIAFFLGWEGYKRFNATGGAVDWRTLLDFVAAALSLILGFTGVRERHRGE